MAKTIIVSKKKENWDKLRWKGSGKCQVVVAHFTLRSSESSSPELIPLLDSLSMGEIGNFCFISGEAFRVADSVRNSKTSMLRAIYGLNSEEFYFILFHFLSRHSHNLLRIESREKTWDIVIHYGTSDFKCLREPTKRSYRGLISQTTSHNEMLAWRWEISKAG